MIRNVLLAMLAGAAVLCAAPSALPADDPAYAFYEKQAKDVLRTAGDKVWGAADDARKCGFHQFAIEQAQRALEYDPEQKDARDFLKYVKKDGKWVQDEAAFKALPQTNIRPSNKNGAVESEESFNKRVKKWEEESLAKADKYVAARYAELGDICAAKGFPEQAKKGYEASMRLDKDNDKARKGLGYTKFGKVWLTKKQDDARKQASKAEAVKETETTVWEDCIGVKMNKVESGHIRIESPFEVAELQQHCLAGETAYAYYLADFGMEPSENVFGDRKALFVVMSPDEQWNKFIDRFGGNDKEFTRQLSGCGVGDLTDGIRSGSPERKGPDGKTVHDPGGTPEGRRDHIVHRITHELNRFVWRLGDKAWLDEGLAYYYTLKVLETTSTFCVARKKGDYANGNKDIGGMKDWGQSDNWKPLMKDLVAKKNDLPLRQIMSQPIHVLQFDASVKAWSVCSYLMDKNRDKFLYFLGQMKDPGVKQDVVFQNTFDTGIEEFEKEWQEYVRRCY